jgi:hypothetical protein
MLMRTTLAVAIAASLSSAPAWAEPPAKTLTLQWLGTYESGLFDEGGAEITAYEPSTQRAFVVNSGDGVVDVLDLSDPSNPTLIDIDPSTLDVDSVDVADDLDSEGLAAGGANSVAVRDGVLAVAVENDVKQAPGWVAFYNTADLSALAGYAEVGALPDMVTFSEDGRYVLTANEGEPNDDYDVDPEGSISVVDISGGLVDPPVMIAGFGTFNDDAESLRAEGVRIFGPDATVAQDLEPEYIATAGNTAWVTLQENNALAVVDIPSATVLDVVPLGYKNHSELGNGLDPSNRDGDINVDGANIDGINIQPWQGVFGMYQPDAIASYQYRGETFIVSANEGDARDYDGFSEEERGADLFDFYDCDNDAIPAPGICSIVGIDEDAELGRLNSTTAPPFGDTNNLYAYGARSFSIWNDAGQLVWDSGDQLEKITAGEPPFEGFGDPENFNSTNDENDSFDNRSDDKGPEPEGVVVGKIEGRTYAFIGLERVGGIVAYDISNPYAPVFMDYLNNRDFNAGPDCSFAEGESSPCDDLGPEGLTFVGKGDSPTGEALLIVGNEVSGTTTMYELDVRPAKAEGPKDKAEGSKGKAKSPKNK